MNQPTRTAILPKLVPADQLPAANALNMTVLSAGAIAGPLVGGALIPVLGYSWLYLIDTITLMATLYAVWRLKPMPVEGTTGAPGLRSVIDGLIYLSGHKILLLSFAVDLIAMIFGMPRALFPEIAHVSFGGPIEGAVTAWGGSMALMGLAVGLSGWQTRVALGVALGMLVVGGASDMVSAAFRQSILLSATDDAVRGRMQGVFIVVVAGGRRRWAARRRRHGGDRAGLPRVPELQHRQSQGRIGRLLCGLDEDSARRRVLAHPLCANGWPPGRCPADAATARSRSGRRAPRATARLWAPSR